MSYRVPSMNEIAAVKKNGFRVASTFSGCGGSCLGFEMAGFEVVWANEFVPEARETYCANHPDVELDGRDIREIDPDSIRRAFGYQEIDVLEGSPPCAAFSTAGRGSKEWGKVRKYSDTAQRVDDLFFEFVRILRGVKPRVFVAENVAGLVRGVAKGYFKNILREMIASGYRVEAQVLDAQWLGVPQARRRVIFIGIRDDVFAAGARHRFPRPFGTRVSCEEALAGVPKAREKEERGLSIVGTTLEAEWRKLPPGGQSEKYFSLVRADPKLPVPTVTASGAANKGIAGVTHPTEPRKFSIPELRRLCSFPDDFVLTGTHAQRWERLGRSVPPLMMKAVADRVLEVLRSV